MGFYFVTYMPLVGAKYYHNNKFIEKSKILTDKKLLARTKEFSHYATLNSFLYTYIDITLFHHINCIII
jgi:hypothetical protein